MADWIWTFIFTTWKVYWPTWVSSYVCIKKSHFVSLSFFFFFVSESELILIENNIQWWSFISIGSSSFSSITVQPEPISANEKLHHWRIYWGHSQFLLEMEEWGPLQRTLVSKEVLWYFTPETPPHYCICIIMWWQFSFTWSALLFIIFFFWMVERSVPVIRL